MCQLETRHELAHSTQLAATKQQGSCASSTTKVVLHLLGRQVGLDCPQLVQQGVASIALAVAEQAACAARYTCADSSSQ